MSKKSQSTEYDSPWKEALDVYFPEFLQLLFPNVYQDIDWERGYEFLDTELQKVVRDANLGKRLADKLVKVWLKDGVETLILIHLEIQGQYDANFTQRMFVYHYRIFDRYRLQVVSLAVLGDDNPQWRPNTYGYERWGSRIQLNFPAVKLWDYRQNQAQLAKNSNPFAAVVLAHLAALETTNRPQQRLQRKWTLVRGLYERGYTREQILQLFRLIDWFLSLPEELTRSFDEQLARYEEEQKMPYITSVERLAIERGELKGELKANRARILEILQVRFGEVPDDLSEKLDWIEEVERLEDLFRQAITIASLEEFESLLPTDNS